MHDAAQNPYAAPASGPAGAHAHATYAPTWFGLHGRVGRGRYLVYSVFPACAFLLLFMPIYMLGQTGPVLAALVVLLAHLLTVALRRLDDLDRSRWWILLAAVPVMNALFVLYLLCASGNPQANPRGPAPTSSTAALTQAAWLGCAIPPLLALIAYAIATASLPA
ncbi:MAG TPA: DUF805 domain-containing protein [Telluria sp.]|jgi:uncharacterized membrane protein YhaH (DUF805 family)